MELNSLAGTRFVSDARGRGEVDLAEPLADSMLVALADGRVDGMSRVVSLCVAGTARECTPPIDGGVADAGADDAAITPDASMIAPPPASCACRSARSGRSGLAWLFALALCARSTWRRGR